MRKKVGLGFLALMCGTMSLAGFSTFFNDLVSNPGAAMSDLVMALLFGAITVFIILKLFGRRIRVIPESRKYSPGNKLPIVPSAGLILAQGEVCHIADKAQIGALKTIKGSVRKSSGTSVYGLFGTSYSGSSRSRSTSEDVIDKSAGMLYVTNKRIVMAAPKYGFEEPLESVTAVTPYANSFDIQLKRGNYTIFVREPVYASSVLQAAVSLKVRGAMR